MQDNSDIERAFIKYRNDQDSNIMHTLSSQIVQRKFPPLSQRYIAAILPSYKTDLASFRVYG